jgi:hypothetical protein
VSDSPLSAARPPVRQRRYNRLAAGLAVMMLTGTGVLVVGASIADSSPAPADFVLCHATGDRTTPYEPVAVPAGQGTGGHEEHSGPIFWPDLAPDATWGDIIPPITVNGLAYSLNWGLGPDEDRLGRKIFNSGCVFPTTTQTVTVTATPPPGATTPVVSNAAQSHETWRTSKASGPSRWPTGTRFTFSLDDAASVKLTFIQHVERRRVSGRCVLRTAANADKPRCSTLHLTRGHVSATGKVGTNAVAFAGKLSNATFLKPGDYSVIITATASGNTSEAVELQFTVVA